MFIVIVSETTKHSYQLFVLTIVTVLAGSRVTQVRGMSGGNKRAGRELIRTL